MLTDARIRSLRAPPSDRWISDGWGTQLYLRVRRTGTKSWVLRRRAQDGGNVTLGQYPGTLLAAARIKAAEYTGSGATQDLTLRALLEEWGATMVDGKHRRAHNTLGYFDRIEPVLLATRLRDLQRVNVRHSLRRYAAERGPISANRLLSILKTALRFARDAGYIESSPIDGLSPDLVGGAETARARVLTDDEIRAIWNTDSQHTPLLRFLLLTGARIGEAQRMTWAHIEDDRWDVPAEHMKNGRLHTVMLSRQARRLLRAVKRDRELVFGSATDTGVQAWVRRWCEREKIAPRFCPHDLRRTFATRLNELGAPPHIVERILSHTLQGVMAVYNHATYEPERVAAMQKWADALDRIVRKRTRSRLDKRLTV
jgi:integrase